MDEAKKLRKSMEELRCDASGMLSCVSQLKGIVKYNMIVEANNKSRSEAVELKEKVLQNLSSEFDKKVETFEKEKSEAGELKKLAEEVKLKRYEVESKEKQLEHLSELQRLCSEETDKKKVEWGLVLEKIKESEKQFEVKSLELASKEKELGVVRDSIELKKKMVNSLNNEITVCAQKIDSKSKESGEIQKVIEQQTSELVGMEKKHKEMLESICRSSSDLAKKVREIKAAETEASDFYVRSERFREEIEDKEKKLNLLKNQIESEEKKLVQLKLKRCLRQIKREKQPIVDSSQQNALKTEPIDDTLMPDGISASLTRPEVSSFLRASPNPAEFVLGLVQDDIRTGLEQVHDEVREESAFQDTFLETLVLLFEELAKIQRPDKSTQLQLQATEVATLWKEKRPKSSLEALAFLLFIMAFGLKTLINEEEAALHAWSIAQYEQAPVLFEYLRINLTIREVVEELIRKGQYIPAVRLICLFKLNKEVSSFSPSELLKKEIVNFRGSALENRSTESSQAKEKDDGRLRAILELVADYKLEIDLPGDLIAKLMVQGERSVPLVSFSVEHDTSSSTPQDRLKKKQLGQTKTVLVKHTGVEDENLGTTLPADVNSSNEASNSAHPPIIHTYQRRRN